jgi:hypothetical protein
MTNCSPVGTQQRKSLSNINGVENALCGQWPFAPIRQFVPQPQAADRAGEEQHDVDERPTPARHTGDRHVEIEASGDGAQGAGEHEGQGAAEHAQI